MIVFAALIGIFCLGAFGALVAYKHDRFANIWGHACAIIGAAIGIIFAGSVLICGNTFTASLGFPTFPFFSLAINIDKLAAFFILIICLIALFSSIYGIGYVREYYKKYSIGVLCFLYNLFIVGMLLVVTASNGIWFLLAWELMSLASYFMVVYGRNNPQNVKAGYIYLVMTHIGAACILLALAILFAQTGSLDFAAIKAGASAIPTPVLAAVFALAFVGLGAKAGAIPLHIWLPSAHPAAPSHVSALMSGVMIKTGIYMMIRLFLDVLQPIPLWWGIVVLAIGAISALLGVLYALTEHNIKRLLAYHSIENIGIILLSLGSAMIFAAQNQPILETLALCAALFHTLNHATFKSLLFLSAGSVISQTHTPDIEKYGGLLKLMPLTGAAFLIGSLAISALPPFNGFFSEWLAYQSLIGGIAAGGVSAWAFLLAGVALAITGGLAIACFVKVFGVTFLARPRSLVAERAKESSPFMTASMLCIAAICLTLGVFSGPIVQIISGVAGQIIPSGQVITSLSTVALGQNSNVNGIWIFALVAAILAGIWLLIKFGINRKQKIRIAPTWDCGTKLDGRMEITATGFARSILLIFGSIVRPKLVKDGSSVKMSTKDVFLTGIYKPFYRGLLSASRFVKAVQNGNINTYILYIFGALIIALMMGVL